MGLLDTFKSRFAAATEALRSQEKQLILIIDDDVQNVTMLRANLENEGYRVDIATDGATGGQKAAQLKPHLIITDVFMPDVDGLSMIEDIREKYLDLAHVPVIFMSGRAMENFLPETDDPSLKLALMRKPIFLPELNTLVRKFLA